MMPHRLFVCRLLFCAVFSVSLINVFTKAASPSYFLRHSRRAIIRDEDVVCPTNDLADDVLVVLRTGATTSHEKLPTHFETTLRCVPHYVIFSDLDEEVSGHTVHNALEGISPSTVTSHPDFKLYQQLQTNGRDGIQQSLTPPPPASAKGDYTNTNNPGWALDKWKFLPMLSSAYSHRPTAKWYLFLEDDTYLIWPNLLSYLANFDSSKPHYLGKHLYINDIEFGYGGAGFIISNPALRSMVERRESHVQEYEDFTKDHWVGDCAVGKVAEDVDIPLTKAWPHLQGESYRTMDPQVSKVDRGAWCFPAITYHRVSPDEMRELWEFEQEWFKRHDHLLRHRDVYLHLLRPHLPSQSHQTLPEWDNFSSDLEFNAHDDGASSNELEREAWKSAQHCRRLCEDIESCIQFSFDSGSCRIGKKISFGYERAGERVQSGWITERVDEVFRGLEGGCGVRDWWGIGEGGGKRKGR
ncbi:glycosyltransferase family 31 protein [Sporormia fimetaria CBS 119925]|uniref:N-acetylgalactosaminide beta-1,3-galactosyltransferase n=1 Tax=Sporormia fimetaria CBS 119925 TaxID=1340428 RepID=A0A6A6VPZ3_9PLEO|nr:glycosyltransferase family 31 protein [Sporormia fimetaria CBS 119925]